MRIISERRIQELADKYSDTATALANWKRTIRAAGWKNHAEVKAQFHDSDLVGEKTVFNIAKNRYRLIAFISFRTQIVYIKEILAHRDYDKGTSETMNTIHTISGTSGMDVRRYGRLLAKFTPKVIETEEENEQALAVVESLMERGDARLAAEELALLDLLGTLIERFESQAYELPAGDPAGALELLMEGRKLKAADLAAVLGSRARVSEILSRKRSISKEQARSLGEYFGVSPAAFI